MLDRFMGQRIIWALDAFEPDLQSFYQNAIQTLSSIASIAQCKVEPVYILNPGHLDLTSEADSPNLQNYRVAAENALNAIVHGFNLQNFLLKPHVIVQRTSSPHNAAESLLDYAYAMNAQLLVMNTHGRSGMSRLILGSFTENVLAKSTLPVLVINPKIQKLNSFDRWIFPTDFGDHSSAVFRTVVNFAKRFNSKLTLFHSVPHPVESMFQSGIYLLGGGWLPVNPYFEVNMNSQIRRASAWSRWATHQGVPTEPVVESQMGALSARIIGLAEEHQAGLILLEEKTRPIMATLLGSITRQIVRSATCPVWVIRYSDVSDMRSAA